MAFLKYLLEIRYAILAAYLSVSPGQISLLLFLEN
jgi:hypothetical protein